MPVTNVKLASPKIDSVLQKAIYLISGRLCTLCRRGSHSRMPVPCAPLLSLSVGTTFRFVSPVTRQPAPVQRRSCATPSSLYPIFWRPHIPWSAEPRSKGQLELPGNLFGVSWCPHHALSLRSALHWTHCSAGTA